jgi:hypothetical protein
MCPGTDPEVCRHGCRSFTRIAVLINEAGAVDVDSELAEVHQAHAAIGFSSVQGGSLAGGCVCCTAHGNLAASLAAVRRAATAEGHRLDYLVGRDGSLTAVPKCLLQLRWSDAKPHPNLSISRCISTLHPVVMPCRMALWLLGCRWLRPAVWLMRSPWPPCWPPSATGWRAW